MPPKRKAGGARGKGDKKQADSSTAEENSESDVELSGDDEEKDAPRAADKIPVEDISEGESDSNDLEGDNGIVVSAQPFKSGMLSGILRMPTPLDSHAPIMSLRKPKSKSQTTAAGSEKDAGDSVDLAGIDTEIAEARRRKRLRRERAAMKEKEHQLPEFDHIEKKLVKIATKGVVTLFNALSKQQAETARLEEENGAKGTKASKQEVAKLSAKGLAQKLNPNSVDSSESAVERTKKSNKPNSSNSKLPVFPTDGANWSVLTDEYMMGGSLKDWDKDDDESD